MECYATKLRSIAFIVQCDLIQPSQLQSYHFAFVEHESTNPLEANRHRWSVWMKVFPPPKKSPRLNWFWVDGVWAEVRRMARHPRSLHPHRWQRIYFDAVYILVGNSDNHAITRLLDKAWHIGYHAPNWIFYQWEQNPWFWSRLAAVGYCGRTGGRSGW